MLAVWAYNYDWEGGVQPVTFKGGLPFNRKKEFERAKKRADLFKQFTEVSPAEVKAKQELSRLIEVNLTFEPETSVYDKLIEEEKARKKLRDLQRERNNRIAMMLLDD